MSVVARILRRTHGPGKKGPGSHATAYRPDRSRSAPPVRPEPAERAGRRFRTVMRRLLAATAAGHHTSAGRKGPVRSLVGPPGPRGPWTFPDRRSVAFGMRLPGAGPYVNSPYGCHALMAGSGCRPDSPAIGRYSVPPNRPVRPNRAQGEPGSGRRSRPRRALHGRDGRAAQESGRHFVRGTRNPCRAATRKVR